MKTQLIMLDTPIIVSDEKVKEGDFCWNTYNNIYEVITEHQVKTANDYIKSGDVFKIIAGIEDLPSIDWNGLEEEFGWIDVEKLAKEATNKQMIRIFGNESKEGIEDDIQKRKYYFKEGFKKAHSLNDKKFSLEDMFKCFQAGIDYEKEGSILQPDAHGYIQSLQQPKVFDIGVEMLSDNPYDPRSKTGRFEIGDTDKVVIRNNSIKIFKKL